MRKNFFVGAAVERAVERGDGRGGGGIRIDVRAPNAANRIGGAILLVVRVQDEKNVERTLEGRVRPVLRFGRAEKGMFRKLPV